jgi:outer membrane protein TolC
MHSLLFVLAIVAAPDTLNLTLDQALGLAFRQSPVRIEVKASQTQSASTLARGLTGLLPTLSGSIGYAKVSQDALPESLRTGPAWTGNLTLGQVVFDPAVFAALAGSVVNYGYYATDARDKQARLIYDVTSSYLGLVKARLLRDAAAAALRRAKENLHVVQERERLGGASRIDVMRSQVFESQAEMNRIGADNGLAVAAELLKATVNLDPDVAVKPADTLARPSELEISRPESLLFEIRRRNPGLNLAARASAVARINSWGTAARVLPSISLYWASNYSDTLFPSSCTRWRNQDQVSYGLKASFPLLDLKSYVLDVVDAANQSRRTKAAALSASLMLNSTATTAILDYEQARKTYDYAQGNLKLNQELYNLAEEQHRLGSISLADLFGVEADLSQAQASYVSALCGTYIQAAQISYLLGNAELPGKEIR